MTRCARWADQCLRIGPAALQTRVTARGEGGDRLGLNAALGAPLDESGLETRQHEGRPLGR